MIVKCRKEYFEAAHKLYNPDWSERKNREVYGVCANPNWHGHRFELIVSVKISTDKRNFYINHEQLSNVIKTEIIEKVHHKNLNLDVGFLANRIPTCEYMIIAFWDILHSRILSISSSCKLHHLRLYETPRNFVDYYGN